MYSVTRSFQGPLEHLEQHTSELVDGKALATSAILRCSQRSVPVLSYLPHLAVPPANTTDLEMWCAHKVFRDACQVYVCEALSQYSFSY